MLEFSTRNDNEKLKTKIMKNEYRFLISDKSTSFRVGAEQNVKSKTKQNVILNEVKNLNE